MGLNFTVFRLPKQPDTRIYQAEANVILHPEELQASLQNCPPDLVKSTVDSYTTLFSVEHSVNENLPLEELEAQITKALRLALTDKMAELLLTDPDKMKPATEPKRNKQYIVHLDSYADWTTRSRNKKPPSS